MAVGRGKKMVATMELLLATFPLGVQQDAGAEQGAGWREPQVGTRVR